MFSLILGIKEEKHFVKVKCYSDIPCLGARSLSGLPRTYSRCFYSIFPFLLGMVGCCYSQGPVLHDGIGSLEVVGA